MLSLFQRVIAIATVTTLTASGFTKSNEITTKSVKTFHQQLDNSKFTEIYSAVTHAFKTATKKADFINLLQAVRHKLGTVKNKTQHGPNLKMFSN